MVAFVVAVEGEVVADKGMFMLEMHHPPESL
jgi:hypothetical protein